MRENLIIALLTHRLSRWGGGGGVQRLFISAVCFFGTFFSILNTSKYKYLYLFLGHFREIQILQYSTTSEISKGSKAIRPKKKHKLDAEQRGQPVKHWVLAVMFLGYSERSWAAKHASIRLSYTVRFTSRHFMQRLQYLQLCDGCTATWNQHKVVGVGLRPWCEAHVRSSTDRQQ